MKAKFILLCAAALGVSGLPAPAATIFFTAPASAPGAFDVLVQAQDLFAGRDTLTDGILSYGFNVSVSNPLLLSFLGATSGPLFDAATTQPGTGVFGAASGFGIFPPVAEPLTLATLHFLRTAPGSVNITISSDLANLFQGLQFFDPPVAESISGVVTLSDVPEPAAMVLCGAGLMVLGIARRKCRG